MPKFCCLRIQKFSVHANTRHKQLFPTLIHRKKKAQTFRATNQTFKIPNPPLPNHSKSNRKTTTPRFKSKSKNADDNHRQCQAQRTQAQTSGRCVVAAGGAYLAEDKRQPADD